MGCLNSSIAGSWYPGDAGELRRMLDGYLAGVPVSEGRVPNVLILPHAGYCYSAQTAMYGIARIMGAKFRRVVLLAPSHRYGFRDRLVAPESDCLRTPFGEIAVDEEALREIAACCPVDRSDAVHGSEHAAQIEYPLLQYALGAFKIVPLVVSELTGEGIRRMAAGLQRVLDKETLLLVSSDFTHYGARFDFAPFEPGNAVAEVKRIDLEAFEAIRACDAARFEECLTLSGATICGRNPIRLMLSLVPPETMFELLHYANSVEATGDEADFVCYLCAAGFADWTRQEQMLSEAEKQTLLSMARRSIEHALQTRRATAQNAFEAEATEAMRQKMGCFVTLNQRSTGHLRGCIGEIEPQRPLYQAVTARAIDAAFRDPRFPQMTAEEWPEIQIEISALTPAHPVDSWRDIVIGKHGMTLEKHGRMAVFLPQVAPEQNWDLATTLTHLALKAGLEPDDWREGAKFTVFEAIVFQERR